ncbi:MAG: hypothetical protein JNK77_10175 [Saprospiraceae bacterium]|nr:hypothetical protein [Saprospiraceae bacterium]
MSTRHLFLACALCIPLGLSAQNMITTGSATSLGAKEWDLSADGPSEGYKGGDVDRR